MKTKTTLCSFFVLILFFFNNYTAQEMHGGVSFPVYTGGFSALKEFISKNIRYPEKSKEDGISGTVTLSYLVNEQGKIRNVKVLRGINAELDSEAVRVARLIPDWIPAEQFGKHVGVKFIMPVDFIIEGNTQKQKEFTISGIITDRVTGYPMEGVLVLIKGTSNGTLSNKDGFYSFQAPDEDSELEFSAIGYEIKSEKIGKNRTINSILMPGDVVIDFNTKE